MYIVWRFQYQFLSYSQYSSWWLSRYTDLYTHTYTAQCFFFLSCFFPFFCKHFFQYVFKCFFQPPSKKRKEKNSTCYISSVTAGIYFPAKCGFNFKVGTGMCIPLSLFLPRLSQCWNSPLFLLCLEAAYVSEQQLFVYLSETERGNPRKGGGRKENTWKSLSWAFFFWTNN